MEQKRGLLVSLEGISGCGKSYFARLLQGELKDPRVRFVSELTERKGEGLGEKIIAALSFTNDRFFRMGLPRTETFLLLAYKMLDYEAMIEELLDDEAIVIEDRSIDTIAVYQAILLCQDEQHRLLDTANDIYALASKWRRPPDITFLIEDEFTTSIGRAEKRSGMKYSLDELELLRNAATLYSSYADHHKDRIIRLNRQATSNEEIVQAIKHYVLS